MEPQMTNVMIHSTHADSCFQLGFGGQWGEKGEWL